MSTVQNNSEATWLCEAWASHIGPAISAMTGQPGEAIVIPDSAATPNPAGLLLWRQPFGAAPGAELLVAVSADVWEQVGGLVLTSAGLEESDPAEVRGTFLEVLQQSLSPLCAVLGSRLRREVHIHPGEPMDELPESNEWQTIQVQVAGRATGLIWALCNLPLHQAIAIPSESATTETGRSKAQKPSKTLDLLMEVELPVGVSFGRAQMRLKDAIKLTTGSIVELNRSISEPVEIIVNNCVIARGEVVVVEGNYGVRIAQIVSREERLRTLF
ncbi:MAG: flagellar motor switch protein FliN [Bryobacterales bacterium]|nr:flagellar motor switch protein FliN [Bryobacterales bacterium]